MKIYFNLSGNKSFRRSWLIPSLFMAVFCFISSSHAACQDEGEARGKHLGTSLRIEKGLIDDILTIETPHLVLGGGSMWRNKSVWKSIATRKLCFQDGKHVILDNRRGAASAPWLKLDFNELDDLQVLAEAFPGHFHSIFFDVAVTKYVRNWTDEHLHYLAAALAPEGQLFLPLIPYVPSALDEATPSTSCALESALFYYSPEEPDSLLETNKENRILLSLSKEKAAEILEEIFGEVHLQEATATVARYPCFEDDLKNMMILSHPYWICGINAKGE